MATRTYEAPQFQARYQALLPGNSGTALLCTPQKGTTGETKTHTTTLLPFGFGRGVILKRIAYCVTTAQTGAGNNLSIDLYNGATSVATLAITTQTAGQTIYSTADINSTVTASGYCRALLLSTSTASDALPAIGFLSVTYEELFA